MLLKGCYVFACFLALSLTVYADLSDLIEENQPSCGCSGNSKLTRELGSREKVEKQDIISIESDTIISNIQSINSAPIESMVLIPGGKSYVGSNKPKLARDGEGPRREVTLSPFYIDKYEVSNTGTTSQCRNVVVLIDVSSRICKICRGNQLCYRE